MNNGIIIQARTNSSRLPGKILLPFYKDENILELIIKRIKYATDIPIVIATTQKESDNSIVKIAKNMKVDFFRGNEENVLARFIDCAKQYNFSSIIRICSDNPFIDTEDLLYLSKQNSSYDYICFSINKQPTITSHTGFWAEKISLNALLKIQKNTTNTIYLEHVTNYIYEHPEMFNIKKNEISGNIKTNKIRLTLDTKEDFIILKKIFSKIYKKKNGYNFTKYDVLNHIEKNPTYLEKMMENIKRNEK